MTALLAGNRLRVMPCATIFGVAQDRRAGEQRRAPLVREVRSDMTMSRTISTMPQAWMMRTATFFGHAEKRERSASARMVANERS